MESPPAGTSKFSKYILYAIGEIVLVVIGILIAIQLNEWRNDRFNSKQKQKVLIALKSDFEANLTRLDTVYYNQEKSLNKFLETKNIIDSINYITDNNVFKANLAHGGYGYSYDPLNGSLRSAISSGDIHLIENERLIELLFSWEDLVIDSNEESEILVRYSYDSYLPIQDKYTQVREVFKQLLNENGSSYSSDFVGLFKNPLFENYTQRMIFIAFQYLKELKEIRVNNVEIIKLIDEELKQ